MDPHQTVVLLHSADEMAADNAKLYCNVPVTLTILTRDQYSNAAAGPRLKVTIDSQHTVTDS